MNYAVAANLIGIAITAAVAWLGRDATLRILDAKRKILVDADSAPTDEQLEELMREVEADVDA